MERQSIVNFIVMCVIVDSLCHACDTALAADILKRNQTPYLGNVVVSHASKCPLPKFWIYYLSIDSTDCNLPVGNLLSHPSSHGKIPNLEVRPRPPLGPSSDVGWLKYSHQAQWMYSTWLHPLSYFVSHPTNWRLQSRYQLGFWSFSSAFTFVYWFHTIKMTCRAFQIWFRLLILDSMTWYQAYGTKYCFVLWACSRGRRKRVLRCECSAFHFGMWPGGGGCHGGHISQRRTCVGPTPLEIDASRNLLPYKAAFTLKSPRTSLWRILKKSSCCPVVALYSYTLNTL